MRPYAFFILGFLALTALPAAPVQSGGAVVFAQSDAERTVRAIETYLQNMTSLKARFLQTGPDGRQATGDFLLKRPGRLRFDYDAPMTDFIVADGRMIYYYDGRIRETSHAPIGQTMADFFLQKDLRLSGGIAVSDVRRDTNGFVLLTLTQAKDPAAGSLTLTLKTDPWRLAGWHIVDAQGLTTTVALNQIEEGIKLDNALFHYYDPNRRNKGLN